MSRTLIICSSTDGQTRRICERLQQIVQAGGDQVSLVPIEEAGTLDPSGFDKIVIGARIRYGKHDPRVLAFANSHAALLNAKPSAFFSVNIVARKPEKNRPETNPYVQKFLTQVAWRPKALAVFAGKLDYPRYGFLDRQMIRFIMLVTKGPTDPTAVVEFTDWHSVETFGQTLTTLQSS